MLGCAHFPQSCPSLCDFLDYSQAPTSMEFFRQDYWSGLPFPSPGDLPNLGIDPTSLVSPAIGRRIPYSWDTLGNMWLETISTVLLKIIYINISTFSSLIKYTSVQYFVILIKKERSRSAVSDSLWPHRLQPTRPLCPWDFPGKSTGVGWHFLLQEIFQSQELNPGLPHCRQMLYHLSHQGHSYINKDK